MPEAGDERLVVLLEARIRDFEKNMLKADKTAASTYGNMRKGSKSATQQMEADMVRSTSRINQALAVTSTKIGAFGKSFAGGFVAPLAGALTLTTAISGARAALEKFGDIADKSAAAGIDPEFFQAIAHQAKLSGVEIDATAGALATFAKNSGLAAEGKGRMVSALQALNPELLKNIQNASTQEERIRLAADAINDAKNAAEAAALATTLFGDAGTKLVATFQGGAAALDEMFQKARDMGLIVERDLIARADELGDKLDTAQEIVNLRLNKAFIDLAPLMVDVVGLGGQFAELMAIAYEQLKGIEQRQFLRPLQNQLAETYNEIGAVKDNIAEMETQLAGQGGQGMLLQLNIDEAKQKLATLEAQAMQLLNRVQELQGYKPSSAAPAASPAASDPNLMGDAGLSLLDLNLPSPAKMEAAAGGIRTIGAAAKETAAAVATIDPQFQALLDQIETATDMAQGFASTIVDGLLNGEDAVQATGRALSDLGRQLIEMATNQLIANFIGTLFGGGLSIAGGAPVPKGGFIPGITGPKLFASGTGNTGGRRGEPRGIVHGQEAVIPLPDGGKVPVEMLSTTSEPAMVTVEVFVRDNGALGAIARQEGGKAARVVVRETVPGMIKSQAPSAVASAQRNRGL